MCLILAYPLKKRTWGDLRAQWVAHDTRDAIMDFIGHWSERTEIAALQLVAWIGLSRSKFYSAHFPFPGRFLAFLRFWGSQLLPLGMHHSRRITSRKSCATRVNEVLASTP